MRIVLALLSLSLACLGQPLSTADPAFMAQQYVSPSVGGGTTPLQAVVDYAKMIPGVYAIYAASNAWFSSASGNATWSNLSSTAGIDLTNLSSGTTFQPVLANNELSGNAALKFDGIDHGGGNGQYLNSANFSLAQQNEYWFVVSISNVYTAGPYLFGSVSTPRQFVDTASAGGNNRMRMSAGTTATSANQVWQTNKLYVVTAMYNGASSKLYTNNIAAPMLSTDAGTGSQNGLTVGAYSSAYAFLGQKLALVIAFATNLDHTATGTSSNLFNLITNCYGITVP